MKKLITLSVLTLVFSLGYAQKRNVITAYNYGIKQGQTRYADAKKAIDEAINHADTKEDEKAWYYRGIIYQRIAESDKPEHKNLHESPLEEAVLSYENSIKFQDKNGRFAKDAIKQLNVVRVMSFNDGIKLFEDKDYINAAKKFKLSSEIGNLPEINFNEDVVYYNAALSFERGNKLDDAKIQYKLSAENNYEPVGCIRRIADITLKEGDTAAYVTILQDGIEKVADNQILMLLLIDHYSNVQQLDIALDYLNKVIEIDPTNKVYHYAKGTFYDKKENFEGAFEAYSKAIELDPDYFDAVFNMGALFFNKGADLNNQANNIPPQEVEEYNAMRDKALAEFVKSTKYFERALEINPTDMYSMKQLKQIYFQLRGQEGFAAKLKEMDIKIQEAEQK